MNKTKIKKYKENPFKKLLMEEIKTVQKRQWVGESLNNQMHGVDNQIVINSDGEPVAETRLFSVKRVDNEHFTKLYTRNLKDFWEMPETAIKVFTYIMNVLKPNQDRFYFNEREAMKITKYKTNKSLWTGRNWLIANKFIAKTLDPYFYFINPTIFFNGDRLVILQAYIKGDTGDPKQLNLFDNTILNNK